MHVEKDLLAFCSVSVLITAFITQFVFITQFAWFPVILVPTFVFPFTVGHLTWDPFPWTPTTV
jgi:hypothetical protein